MKHTIWAVVLVSTLMIGCGAEPTPIPPTRPVPSISRAEDQAVLSKAIDFVYEKCDLPDSFKTGQKSLIVQRHTFVLKGCGKIIYGFEIVPNDKGYLEFHGETKEPLSPDFGCWAWRAIFEMPKVSQSQKWDCLRRNVAQALLPDIASQHKIQLADRHQIEQGAFPDAGCILKMTLPGYSMNGQEACLYLAFRCGVNWSAGWAVFFNFERGEWRVANAKMAWQS